MEARRALNRTMALRPPPQLFVARPPPPAMKTCAPTKDARLVMIADPDGARATGFRILRDTLVGKGLPPVLAVTSAQRGDGKTTCAINLAIALGEQRMGKVLLLEGCFASPALGRILGVDHAVPAQAPPFTLSQMTPFLHVATTAPGAFVDAATLVRFLHGAQRAGYRHVVIDAPAVESASMILQVATGALLVVRAKRSRARELRRAVETIGARKAVGVTLVEA